MTEAGRVMVYAFAIYDIRSDEMQRSRRMATREAIAQHGGVTIENTELEIDAAHIGQEIAGMTVRNFGPHSLEQGGFQRRVRAD